MLFFKKAAMPAVVPVKSSLMDRETELIPEGYETLAKDAGFAGFKEMKAEHEFERFLAENGIGVYDAEDVDDYLQKVRPFNTVVGWIPVRERSRPLMFIKNRIDYRLDSAWTEMGLRDKMIYRKNIPDVVLMTMAKILDRFSSVEFYVSDFLDGKIKADPFLMVQYQYHEYISHYIIERWDEPGFRSSGSWPR